MGCAVLIYEPLQRKNMRSLSWRCNMLWGTINKGEKWTDVIKYCSIIFHLDGISRWEMFFWASVFFFPIRNFLTSLMRCKNISNILLSLLLNSERKSGAFSSLVILENIYGHHAYQRCSSYLLEGCFSNLAHLTICTLQHWWRRLF